LNYFKKIALIPLFLKLTQFFLARNFKKDYHRFTGKMRFILKATKENAQ